MNNNEKANLIPIAVTHVDPEDDSFKNDYRAQRQANDSIANDLGIENPDLFMSALTTGSRHTIRKLKYGTNTRTLSGRQKFRVTGYRWLIMILFASSIFNGAIVIVGFSSLLTQMALAFDVDMTWVTLLIILPSLLYIPMSFVTASLYNKLRTNQVVYLAVILQFVGCWIRTFSFHVNKRFWPILFGTTIYVLALPMCTNAISLIANLWFPDD